MSEFSGVVRVEFAWTDTINSDDVRQTVADALERLDLPAGVWVTERVEVADFAL